MAVDLVVLRGGGVMRRVVSAENIEELRAWANSRIEQCRRQELKFGDKWSSRLGQPPQALIEAVTEQRTLQAVLTILDSAQALTEYAKAAPDFDATVLQAFIDKYPEHSRALQRYAYIQVSSVPATPEEIDNES